MIDPPADHDWTKLYEPQNIIRDSGNINDESGRNCQKSDLCPHQSEVYTHLEYKTIACFSLPTLTVSVNAAMAEGWRPQGGLLHFSGSGAPDDGLFYQAMVRGI